MARLISKEEFENSKEGIGYIEQQFPKLGEQWNESETWIIPCCWYTNRDGRSYVASEVGTGRKEGYLAGYNVHHVPTEEDDLGLYKWVQYNYLGLLIGRGKRRVRG